MNAEQAYQVIEITKGLDEPLRVTRWVTESPLGALAAAFGIRLASSSILTPGKSCSGDLVDGTEVLAKLPDEKYSVTVSYRLDLSPEDLEHMLVAFVRKMHRPDLGISLRIRADESERVSPPSTATSLVGTDPAPPES